MCFVLLLLAYVINGTVCGGVACYACKHYAKNFSCAHNISRIIATDTPAPPTIHNSTSTKPACHFVASQLWLDGLSQLDFSATSHAMPATSDLGSGASCFAAAFAGDSWLRRGPSPSTAYAVSAAPASAASTTSSAARTRQPTRRSADPAASPLYGAPRGRPRALPGLRRPSLDRTMPCRAPSLSCIVGLMRREGATVPLPARGPPRLRPP